MSGALVAEAKQKVRSQLIAVLFEQSCQMRELGFDDAQIEQALNKQIPKLVATLQKVERLLENVVWTGDPALAAEMAGLDATTRTTAKDA